MRLVTVSKKESFRRVKSPHLVPSLGKGSVEKFDRNRLVHELLSLGNEQITPALAHQMASEVEQELSQRAFPSFSAEQVSEIVKFKLEEQGLIQVRKPRSKTPTSSIEEETVMPTPPAAEEPIVEKKPSETSTTAIDSTEQDHTSLIPGHLANSFASTNLSHLEKFLRPTVQHPKEPVAPLIPTSQRSFPPRATIQLSEHTLKKFQASCLAGLEEAEALQKIEKLFEQVAQRAASAERLYSSTYDKETLVIEFYNLIANQEFYPHLLTLLASDLAGTNPTYPVWIPLSSDPNLQEIALKRAITIWRQRGFAGFSLHGWSGEQNLTADLFETWVLKLEKAILELPEDISIPKSVGLYFSFDSFQERECLRLILSGKFFPKFSIYLATTAEQIAAMEDPRAEGAKLLKEIWKKSEPNIVFLDGTSEAALARPDGGPALEPYEVCNLGSLNLSILATDNDIEWSRLRRITRTAVHFLDNLIDMTPYPCEEVAQASLANRKIGIGVMGFADLLIKLGIPYDSEEAVNLAEKLMRFIRHEAIQASQAMAEQRGGLIPLRHASLLSIESVPLLSELAGVTPGIEPLQSIIEKDFDKTSETFRPIPLLKQISQQKKIWSDELEYQIVASNTVRDCLHAPRPLRLLFATQKEIDWHWQLQVAAAFQKYCDGNLHLHHALSEEAQLSDLLSFLRKVSSSGIRQVTLPAHPQLQLEIEEEEEAAEVVEPLLEVPVELAEDFRDIEDEVTEIASLATIGFQPQEEPALASELSEVSEQSEASEEIPIEEVKEESFDTDDQTVCEFSEQESEPEETTSIVELESEPATWLSPRERPEVLQASSRVIQTGCGPMHVTLARDEKGPYELLARVGKAGGCANSQTEAISRLASLCLSVGVDPDLVYQQIQGIRCPLTAIDHGDTVHSCADGISKVFERELGLEKKDDSF